MLINFYIYLYLILLKIIITEVLANINILDQGILPLRKNSVAIQFYMDIENVDRLYACKVHSRSKRCCLVYGKERHCNLISIYGEPTRAMKPRDRETIVYVYPTLYQHDQIGFCDFELEYRCGNRMLRRQEVNIPFDTRLNSNTRSIISEYADNRKITECDTLDEDSLNNCYPVDCDFKYSGKMPFYDVTVNQCVRAPICIADPRKDLPDVVYVPKGNICRDLDNPMAVADIYAITSNLGIVTESTMYNDDSLAVQVTSNCSTISQNLNFLLDMMYGKLSPIICDTSDFSKSSKSAVLSILVCIISLCAVLFSFVCCVNTVAWLYKKWSSGELKTCFRDLKSKFRVSKSVFKLNKSNVDPEVRNSLLREVIIRDLPLDMRNSLVDVCERMGKVRRKKRYRAAELGSQINLFDCDNGVSTATSTISVYDVHENELEIK